MFFNEDRPQFFNPLSGKYREVVVQCLRLLYQRLYTDLRDYGHSLNRDQLLDIFLEAVARAPVLDGDQDEGRFKSQRELASFILKRLLNAAWLEKQVDDTTLQSTFSFTRAGRIFTQPFVEMESARVRTRHRNTRNTRNSLQAFLDSGEVHDLLDAYECSERIISDFTDIIAELEEQDATDIIVVAGGVIPRQDYDFLYKAGVKGIFGPGTKIPPAAKDVLVEINKAQK